MSALSTGAAPGSDAVRLDASGMDAFDPNMAFDESLLYVKPPKDNIL
jgi:hypothetical protein